jgi:hypothetical protein
VRKGQSKARIDVVYVLDINGLLALLVPNFKNS